MTNKKCTILTCVIKLYKIIYSFILMYKRVARKTDMNSNLSIEMNVTVTVADWKFYRTRSLIFPFDTR